MAQTPKSLSANVNTALPTTFYTVPTGKTAVVNSIIPATNLQSQSVTLNKLSGGTTYPVVRSYTMPYTPATGATTLNSPNMLSGPITLEAGESLTASVATSTALNGQKVAPIVTTTYQLQSGTPQFTSSLFANGIYMVIGFFGASGGTYSQYQGFVITSTDGLTWTYQSGFPTGYAQLQNIVYGGGVWVATGYDSGTNNSATVWTSSDNGVSWTKTTLPSSTSWAYQIWYLNGNFIVGDNQSYIYVSTDGLTWTRKTGARDLNIGPIGNSQNTIVSANYVNSIYFFGTRAGTITSTDLTTFSAPYAVNNCNATSVVLSNIQYSQINSTWYAFGSTNGNAEATPCFFTSSDGINWTWNTNLYSSNIINGGYLPSQFATSRAGTNANIYIGAAHVDSNSITYSTNGGTTWTRGTYASTAYRGPFRTLSNGAFIQYSQASNDGNGPTCYMGIWNINVNPALTTVTQQFSLGAHNYGLIGDYIACASNGTGWVGWFWLADTSSARQFGGTSASTCADYSSVTPNGYPIAATWLPATSKYYMITDAGNVYSTTAYNVAYTSLGQVSGIQGQVGGINLTTIGSYLVITTDTGAKYSTDGITWTTATNPSTMMYGQAGSAGRGAATDGTKLVTLYSSNQVVVTTNGTSYTTSPYPDGMVYQTTLNGNNIANFYGVATSYVAGVNNITYTSSTYANYPTGYTKITATGFGSPAWTSSNPARYNTRLIAYTNSQYVFSISQQNSDGSTTAFTTTPDLLNFSSVTATNVQSMNGVSYFTNTGSTLTMAANTTGKIVFVPTNAPSQGVYLTQTSTLAVPTTLTAGIVEIS